MKDDRIDLADLFTGEAAMLLKADQEFQRAFENFAKAKDLKGMYVAKEYLVRLR